MLESDMNNNPDGLLAPYRTTAHLLIRARLKDPNPQKRHPFPTRESIVGLGPDVKTSLGLATDADGEQYFTLAALQATRDHFLATRSKAA